MYDRSVGLVGYPLEEMAGVSELKGAQQLCLHP